MVWRVMLPGSGLGETVALLGILCVTSAILERRLGALSSCLQHSAGTASALLSHSLLNLPDLAHNPSVFTEITLGIDWIETIWRPKRSSSNTLTLSRKDPIYLSTNREHSTFQVYSPNEEATKRKERRSNHAKSLHRPTHMAAL